MITRVWHYLDTRKWQPKNKFHFPNHTPWSVRSVSSFREFVSYKPHCFKKPFWKKPTKNPAFHGMSGRICLISSIEVFPILSSLRCSTKHDHFCQEGLELLGCVAMGVPKRWLFPTSSSSFVGFICLMHLLNEQTWHTYFVIISSLRLSQFNPQSEHQHL